MSRALLAFNPEAHGSGGDRLFFGVAVPVATSSFALSPLEELNLASRFLEARPGTDMVALLQSIIQRASTPRGAAIDPQIVGSLLHRLTRTAALVRLALRSGDVATRYPTSPEAIFGTELEGLSPEDREFETARRFVRFADEMTRVAARATPGASPDIVASYSEWLAARRLAPGLSRVPGPPPVNFRARRRARLGQ